VSDYIPEELKARIRQQARNRCGYCRSLQQYVWGTLEIEHTIPKSAEDGTHIIGRTACGRATVKALKLNHSFAITVRRSWVSVGWHPPLDEE
jgi:hypothetical protein